MATWIVPQGCCYACILKGGTGRYVYASGESVPLEHQPYATYNSPIYVLVDFANGYIYLAGYNRKDLADEPLFIIDNDTQTVSCHPTNYVTDHTTNLLYAVASPYTLSISSKVELNGFQFGDGNNMLESTDFPPPYGSGVTMFYSPMFAGRTDLVDMSNVVLPSSANRLDSTFARCTSLTTPPAMPNNLESVNGAFSGCTSLVTPPPIPSGVIDMGKCFMNCTALTTPPSIPSSVNRLWACFSGCTSLTSFPEISSTVNDAHECFMGCTSIAGNCIVNAGLSTQYDWMRRDIFTGTVNDIYVVYNGSSASDVQQWETIVSQYSNVHYEANDNPVPSLSVRVTRVDSALSETPSELGEYAYINATAIINTDYLPIGWTDSFGTKTLTKDGTTISPTWTQTVTDNTYTLKCWVPLGDIAKHTFTLQVTDDIKDANNTTKATHQSLLVTQSLSKAYKLVDYYHESDPDSPNYDTEGMSVGKYATEANLFDVDMPSRFRDSVTVDNLVGEIKMWAGNTAPTGWLECDGSEVAVADYPLLNDALGGDSSSGIGATLWGAASDSDHFILPNLMGRVPVGYDSSQTEFDTVGETGGSKYIQAHTHAFTNPTIQNHSHSFPYPTFGGDSGALHYETGGALSGSGSKYAYIDGSSTNRYPSATTSSGGGSATTGGSVGAINTSGLSTGTSGNLQPYAVVKYIICAI